MNEPKGWPYEIFFHVLVVLDEPEPWPRSMKIIGTYRGAESLGYAQEAQRRKGGYILKVLGWEVPDNDDDED